MRPRFDMQPREFRSGELAFHGIAMLICGVIFISLIALLIWYVMKHSTRSIVSADPLAIAKTRYAKGEITKAEYNELKKELLAD